jgi:hypothetical protein
VAIQFDSALFLLQFFWYNLGQFFSKFCSFFFQNFKIWIPGFLMTGSPELHTPGGYFGACQARLSGIGGAPRLQDDPPVVGSQ